MTRNYRLKFFLEDQAGSTSLLILPIVIITVLLMGLVGYFVGSTYLNHSEPESVVTPDSPIDEDQALLDEFIDDPLVEASDEMLISTFESELQAKRYVILNYHHIDPNLKGNPVTLTPDHFYNHMQALIKSGYQTIRYNELAEFFDLAADASQYTNTNTKLTKAQRAWLIAANHSLERMPDQAYHITFDDGYQSVYEYALPILIKDNIPMTFFVITKSSGKEWYDVPDYISFPHATWEELKIINRYPQFSVQSHTYSLHSYEPADHYDDQLPALANPIYRDDLGRIETRGEFQDRIRQDMLLARNYLEYRLEPHTITGMAYPYGVYSDDVIKLAQEVGLKYLFINRAGTIDYQTSPYLIPRYNAGDPTISSRQLVEDVSKYLGPIK